MVTDKLEIALNFNNFYVNIGKKLYNDIPTNSGDPLLYINTQVPDSIQASTSPKLSVSARI